MKIQRYGLVRETNERGREEARIASLDLGDLVVFADHAADVAAKDAEIERLRKQRDKLADRIYEMEFKSHPDASFAHAHECASRALAFAGLRVVDGNIEETSES